MSSGRKSITRILCEASPQNNPEVHDFLIAGFRRGRSESRHDARMRDVGCGFFEERCQSLRSDFKRTGGSGFCFDAFLDAGRCPPRYPSAGQAWLENAVVFDAFSSREYAGSLPLNRA